MAEKYVEAVLKAPSTAEFPHFWSIDEVTRQEGNVFYITSVVDAQNSFGAMIRSDWYIEIEYTGGEPAAIDNWKLNAFTFDGETLF